MKLKLKQLNFLPFMFMISIVLHLLFKCDYACLMEDSYTLPSFHKKYIVEKKQTPFSLNLPTSSYTVRKATRELRIMPLKLIPGLLAV